MPLNLHMLRFVDRPVTKEEGIAILERDGYRCQYCGLDGMASFENALNMSVDFVMPRARKGKKDPRNLVACCRSCNMIKGTRIYRDFDDAKQYVLAQRETLREAWEDRKWKHPAGKPAKAKAPAASAEPEKKKSATASIIGSSPLSLRK
jgi:HNH endonuclease